MQTHDVNLSYTSDDQATGLVCVCVCVCVLCVMCVTGNLRSPEHKYKQIKNL